MISKLFDLIKTEFFSNDINNLNIITYILRIKTYLRKCSGIALVTFISTYIVGLAIVLNLSVHIVLYTFAKESGSDLLFDFIMDIVPLIVDAIIAFMSLTSIIYRSHNCKTYDLHLNNDTPYIDIPNTPMKKLTNEERFYILKTLGNGSYLCQTISQNNNSISNYNHIDYEIISPDKNIIYAKCQDNIFNGSDSKMDHKKHKFIQKKHPCECDIKKYDKRHRSEYAMDHAWHFILETYILIPVFTIVLISISVFLLFGIKNISLSDIGGFMSDLL